MASGRSMVRERQTYGPGSTNTESKYPLPAFILKYFPVLSENEDFHKLYDWLVDTYHSMEVLFLIRFIKSLVLIVLPVITPILTLLFMFTWLFRVLWISPFMFVLVTFLRISGIYKSAGLIIIYAIQALDFYGSYFLTFIFVFGTSIYNKWMFIKLDIIDAYLQLRAETADLLKTLTKLAKKFYVFIYDVLTTFISEAKLQSLIVYLHRVLYVFGVIFLVVKQFLIDIESAVSLIIETWKDYNVVPDSEVEEVPRPVANEGTSRGSREPSESANQPRKARE